jgi:hypothetical protein
MKPKLNPLFRSILAAHLNEFDEPTERILFGDKNQEDTYGKQPYGVSKSIER